MKTAVSRGSTRRASLAGACASWTRGCVQYVKRTVVQYGNPSVFVETFTRYWARVEVAVPQQQSSAGIKTLTPSSKTINQCPSRRASGTREDRSLFKGSGKRSKPAKNATAVLVQIKQGSRGRGTKASGRTTAETKSYRRARRYVTHLGYP